MLQTAVLTRIGHLVSLLYIDLTYDLTSRPATRDSTRTRSFSDSRLDSGVCDLQTSLDLTSFAPSERLSEHCMSLGFTCIMVTPTANTQSGVVYVPYVLLLGGKCIAMDPF